MDCLCLTTRRAARALTSLYEAELRPCGVTPAQFGLLSLLAARPGLAQQELASETDLDQTTLSRSLALLVSAGWVRRGQSKTDARQTLYTLTAAGRKRCRAAATAWKRAQRRMRERLGGDWVAAFAILENLYRLAASEATIAPSLQT